MHAGSVPYVRHVLEAWGRLGIDQEHSIQILTRPENLPWLTDVVTQRMDIVSSPPFPGGTLGKVVWEQTALVRVVRRDADVLFAPGNIGPLLGQVPTVVVFHNLAPFCDSITLSSVGLRSWLRLKSLGVLMQLSAKRVKRVIFLSKHFRDYFVRRYGFDASRADVILNGRSILEERSANGSLSATQLDIRQPYILVLSHLHRYKRLENVISACARLRASLQRNKLQIAIVGHPFDESYSRDLSALIKRRDLGDVVRLTGSIPPDQVLSLIRHCYFFVFQSTCENCPITLIEALSSHVPIACSHAPAMPEIAGDAALYFDPFDPDDIAEKLSLMMSSSTLREDLSKRTWQQVQSFPTWDEVATLVLASLERAVSANGTGPGR